MSKLRDMMKVQKKVNQVKEIFGASAKFNSEFRRRCQSIGKTICNELRISKEAAMELSEETELGPKAEKKFAQLKRWLSTQDDAL